MVNLGNIFRYYTQYGLFSLVGLLHEKLFVDTIRFSGSSSSSLPLFPERSFVPDISDVIGNQSSSAVHLPLSDIASSGFKNICYLTHYFYPTKQGGTERYILNMAKQMQIRGLSPFVLTLGNRHLNDYDHKYKSMYFSEYFYDGIRVIEVRHKKSPLGIYYKNINEYDSELADFAEFLIQKESIDIVHAAYPQPFFSFLKRCFELNIPYIVTLTDFCLVCHYSSMVMKNGSFCEGSDKGRKCKRCCKTYGVSDFEKRFSLARELLENAEYITAPSEFVARVFANEFGEDIRIFVVKHGISEAFNCENTHRKTVNFLYAGTIAQLKGIHTLIEAFNELNGDYRLRIFGSGDDAYIRKLKKNIKGDISFEGAVKASEMPDLYKSFDCVVIPSAWYETYNFVIREALMSGCLVVASNMGAMPEVVIEGENGYLFEAGNKDSLLKALKNAAEFDWKKYKRSTFQSISEEGEIYFGLYDSTEALNDRALPLT